MSSEIASKAENLLKEHLIKGDLSYTYKLLSRELNINVGDSKKILFEFYENNKELLDVNYVIVGYVEKENNLSKVIKITSTLEDKTLFSKIESIQVYSISIKNIKINEDLININLKLHSYDINKDNLKTWGVIEGPELIPTEGIKVKPEVNEVKEVKEVVKEVKSEKKKEPDMGLLSDRIRRQNPEAKKKTSQPTFGKSSTTVVKKANTKIIPRSKTDSNVEVIEDQELNDEEYIKKNEAEKKEAERKRKELESMFDDDDDDFEMVDSDKEEAEVENIKEEVKEIPQKRPLEDLEGIFDSSFSQTQSQEKKEEAKKVEEEQPTSYYDEDGYLVTVKKTETKPKSKPKTAQAALPKVTSPTKKTKTGPRQQSTLLNFFGKPKK